MEIDGETRCFGLIGAPVAHSLSPYLHNRTYAELGLNCCYLPFHVEPEHLAAALQGLKALGFGGVNVTMPHKEAVLPYLDQLEEEAARAGSVNTICLR
ncbi:MAG TPA: shikimate dehydrogenase, partial [Bacillota bacterium]|nr:shikimate dehydrogenase [Bacillota bacterium]